MLQLIAAALISVGTTPGPIPQKRVECNRGCYVYNDGGSWGLTIDAGVGGKPVVVSGSLGVYDDGGTFGLYLDGGFGSSTALFASQSDLTIYVDQGGSDSHDCSNADAGAACLTIQSTLNRMPKSMRHREKVSVACGNYTGFNVAGFIQDNSTQSTTGGLLIEGTLAASTTLASGPVSGTASSGTSGSVVAAPITRGTLTDSTANWTVDDLRGRFISRTGGTGATTAVTYIISSNTATTITIVGTWTAPNATSTYTIKDACSIINTCIASLPTSTTNGSGSAQAINFESNSDYGLTSASGITISNFGITCGTVNLSSGAGVVSMRNIQNTSNASVHYQITGQTTLTLFLSYSAFTTHAHDGKAHVQALYGGVHQCVGCLMEQGQYAANMRQGSHLDWQLSEFHMTERGIVTLGGTASIATSWLGCDGQAGEWAVQVGDSHDGMTGAAYVSMYLTDFNNCYYLFQQGGGYLAVGTNGAITGLALGSIIKNLGGGKAVFTTPAILATSTGSDIVLGSQGLTAVNFADLQGPNFGGAGGCIYALVDGSSVCKN